MTSQAGHCQESPMKMLTTQFMTERLSHLLPITQPRDFPCAYPHYFFHQSGLVISKRSSEHISNRSQTIHFISLCQAAEPWPQVTLLTQTAATSSTPVSLPASAVHYGCIQHLVGYAPFSAQWAATQFPLCLALAFWAGFVLADLRHTQKKKIYMWTSEIKQQKGAILEAWPSIHRITVIPSFPDASRPGLQPLLHLHTRVFRRQQPSIWILPNSAMIISKGLRIQMTHAIKLETWARL